MGKYEQDARLLLAYVGGKEKLRRYLTAYRVCALF